MAKAKEETGTAIATGITGKTTLATRAERVGQGSENVGMEDRAVPRIKLIQSISNEVQPGHPDLIEGAQAGMFFNSVNKQLFTSFFVINLSYDKNVVVWKKRKLGGGMFGTFQSEVEARTALQEAGEPEENFDISVNPFHLVLPIDPESGEPQSPAIMDFPGIKAKKSKLWNSLIAEAEAAGQPRFSTVWEISSAGESNSEGNYMNIVIEKFIEAPDAIYDAAVKCYDWFYGEQAATAEQTEEAA